MLYSIQFTSFEAAEFITSTLNNYQCETLQHLDKQVSPEQYKKPIKAILSAKFEKEIGGLKNVIELVKKRGAKSLVIIEENAGEFSVERSMNSALLRLYLPKTRDTSERQFVLSLAVSFITEGECTIAADPLTIDLLNLSRKVAKSNVNVFINGPTGSGKEVLAKYIHNHSPRAASPFVAINCAAIPENMLEALLFGHKKGAFTGASTASDGIFKAADGGTLLLDEVSEMSMPLQAKLLRVLQEKSVVPLGAATPVPVDVRTLATSNRNIPYEIRQGHFREDLYFRLNVFPLATYSLCDRKKDVLPIAAELLVRHQTDLEDFPTMSSGALELLQNYSWPGNVRELENVIQRATVLKTGNKILEDDIMIDKPMYKSDESHSMALHA